MDDKDPASVMAEDLSFSPISLAKSKINYKEKSVTSTVLWLARENLNRFFSSSQWI